MRRRRFLRAAGSAGLVATGGCLGLAGADEYAVPPVPADRPAGVYRPGHGAAAEVVGVADAGPFRLGLVYSYPDRFWELTGRKTYLRGVEPDDEVHLMALAWDPETGTVLPEVGLTVTVRRDGDLLAQEAVYAMLSQRLGFHYGDNFALDGDGTYEVEVSVGGLQMRTTGAFVGRFGDPASTTFTFDYARRDRNDLATSRPEGAGAAGAMSPADLPGVPNARAPERLPGDRLGAPTVDDAVLETVLLRGEAAARFDADRYLAVSPRTPYNRMLLPAMGLRVRLVRDGGTSFERILARTLDPDLAYHYGTAVPEFRSGDELVVETLTPPQVARHEGYETAFVEMESARLPL
ncbi:iron transporter [Halorarius halobius]|uniref:iron transporter n=1 Tax=Halorarius halobius TaxID=2962671 RepID=UPI0020CDA77B|nr:iron transporter [Halorarius halobius]